MNEALNQSSEPTLPGFDAPISSPGLAAGTSPSSSPAGTTPRSGPAPAPANPTRLRGSRKGTPTPETSGPTSSASLRSAALNTSLANKLRARLSTVGSIEYTQTWKELATPSGRRYWAHTASARTIYVNVSTGVLLSRFNTTRATDGSNGGPNQANGALSSDAAAAAWPLSPSPSPSVGDATGGRVPPAGTSATGLRPDGKKAQMGLQTIARLSAWEKTPMAGDGDGGVMEIRPGTTGKYKLRDFAQLAAFPTTTRDSKSEGKDAPNRTGSPSLPALVRGVIADIFYVPTGRRVVLAPEFSLWLMGFPEAWVKAAPGAKDWLDAQAALVLEYSRDQETPSSPTSPPSSSEPSETHKKIWP